MSMIMKRSFSTSSSSVAVSDVSLKLQEFIVSTHSVPLTQGSKLLPIPFVSSLENIPMWSYFVDDGCEILLQFP